jgi:hypothetical protein
MYNNKWEEGMIIPNYEKIKEETICQECYGYTKGGEKVPLATSLTNPISLYFNFLCHYTAAASKVALSTSFWLMSTKFFNRN